MIVIFKMFIIYFIYLLLLLFFLNPQYSIPEGG